MVFQLQQQLRGSIQLPICLKVISYLKRIGTFDEKELRLCFLHNRTLFLNSVLSNIPTTNTFTYVSSSLTLLVKFRFQTDGEFSSKRKNFFSLPEIFFFLPSSQLSKLTDESRNQLFDILTQYRTVFPDDSESEEGGLLYGWANKIISDYVATFQR